MLLTNVGTPDEPTPRGLRRYLKQFLSDPRVIEVNRVGWWVLLHGVILRTRPKRSAHAYKRIWTAAGSPLRLYSEEQRQALATRLDARFGDQLRVAVGMGYGEPSIASALAQLKAQNCRRVLVFPLFPQYSSATVGSTYDAVFGELQRWRWVPELRTIGSYHDEPLYIAALATSVRRHWEAHGEPQRLLLSFHGLPKRYFLNGDPYYCHCQKTARLLVDALQWHPDRIFISFQSRFGREEWLKPYTDATLAQWAKEKLSRIDVICPGFSADCLETLEELALQNKEDYQQAGGGDYHYIPALNDDAGHIDALEAVILRNLQGWTAARADPQELQLQAQLATSKSAQFQGAPVAEDP